MEIFLILKFIWLTRKFNGNRLFHKCKLYHDLPILLHMMPVLNWKPILIF